MVAGDRPGDPAPGPVQVRELVRDFGELRAVDRVSFTVGPGEIYGLLGPNGAGKTTTIRMIAGLLRPTSGEVRLLGRAVDADPVAAKRSLGYLTAETGLYARLTPREMLAFFADLHGLSRAQARERIAGLERGLDLGAFIDRPAEKLSSGQKQRAAIARALVHDPPVLVLDEPTAALDVVSAQYILELLRGESARGKAIVFSTHHMAEVELLCHRVGVIANGRLVAEGTVPDLLEQTGSSSFTRAFLTLVGAPSPREATP